MINKDLKLKIGKYKMLFNRLISYLGILNFIMLLYIFVKNQPVGLNWFLWVVLIGVFCIMTIVFDSFFVLEGDGAYQFNRNPKLVEMENDIKTILNILQEK